MNASKDDPKVAKKLAKAAAKAAKKQRQGVQPVGSPPPGAGAPVGGRSPAERSAEAAERQVRLQRWRVLIALLAAVIGLVTLLVLLLRR
jgi:hypothetical protein